MFLHMDIVVGIALIEQSVELRSGLISEASAASLIVINSIYLSLFVHCFDNHRLDKQRALE